MKRLRSLWKRYLHWRVSGPVVRAPDTRPPAIKADVDPELMNRQSRALSTEMQLGG